MAREGRAAQRAAVKRKQREREVREVLARRRAAAQGSRKTISSAPDLPIYECVMSRGWQERGLAHILLVRRLPSGKLLVGGYYVDTLCLGLKDSAVMPSVGEDEYRSNVKPNLFNDPIEFEDCDPGVARAVVEGAIEFASRFGFKPNRRWEESSTLWKGIEPKAEGITFGRDGKACLVKRGGDKATGAIARLERKAGPGNFIVQEENG